MTPKEKMNRSIYNLAKSLKPTGRLNADDMKRASDARKKMSFSEIKDAKKLGKAAKMASKVASGMRMGVVGGLKKAMKTSPKRQAPTPQVVISRRRAKVKR